MKKHTCHMHYHWSAVNKSYGTITRRNRRISSNTQDSICFGDKQETSSSLSKSNDHIKKTQSACHQYGDRRWRYGSDQCVPTIIKNKALHRREES